MQTKSGPKGAGDGSPASAAGTGASRIIGGDPVNPRPGERAHHGRCAPGFRVKQGKRERRKALRWPPEASAWARAAAGCAAAGRSCASLHSRHRCIRARNPGGAFLWVLSCRDNKVPRLRVREPDYNIGRLGNTTNVTPVLAPRAPSPALAPWPYRCVWRSDRRSSL